MCLKTEFVGIVGLQKGYYIGERLAFSFKIRYNALVSV